MAALGILGAPSIAVNAVIWPARRRDDVRIAAIASRSNGAEYARRHGIESVHTVPTEGADIVGNMTAIDSIYAAAGFERPWH